MSKTLGCKVCQQIVEGVSDNAGAVTCWECVAAMVDEPQAYKKKTTGYARGWRFMKQFVHVDGTVYQRGVEQPKLKGTLEPTPIKPPVDKKTKADRAREREADLITLGKLKAQLKKETGKMKQKKLRSQIKKLQKKLL